MTLSGLFFQLVDSNYWMNCVVVYMSLTVLIQSRSPRNTTGNQRRLFAGRSIDDWFVKYGTGNALVTAAMMVTSTKVTVAYLVHHHPVRDGQF